MNLKVQKVDQYQFVNKNFTIAVVLPDNFPDISRRTSNLPLKVDVCFDEEVSQFDALDRNYNPNLVDVVSNTNIDRSRRAVVTLKLKEPSANHNNKKFVIRFTALTLEGDVNSICGYSIPITVVRFKLKIQEEFSDHGSYIWMKDVGGKDKSIDLQVGIVDNNDTFVMNRRVPLRVALLYASGVLVPQQDILQLSPDSQLLIGQGGFTRIKCRINEVSSRHQGQLFQILISPDYDLPSPLADISPARSVPVEVKSKINFSHKRKMQALGDTSPTNPANPAAVGSSSYHATSAANEAEAALEDSKLGLLRNAYTTSYDAFRARSFDNFTTTASSALPVVSAPLPMTLSVAQLIKPSAFLGSAAAIQNSLSHSSPHPSLSTHAPHPSSILPLSSVLSNSRAESAVPGAPLPPNGSTSSNSATSEDSVPQGSLLTANLTFFAKRQSSDALNEMYHRAFHRGGGIAPSLGAHAAHGAHSALSHNNDGLLLPVAPIETGLWGRSSVQAAEALKDLTSWVELVYSSLREMQWTPLGHLHQPVNPETGLPIGQDERVMYQMRNPNKLIEGLALGYQERVMAHLTTLDSFITLRALTPKGHSHQHQGHQGLQGLPHPGHQGLLQIAQDLSPTHAATATTAAALYAHSIVSTSAPGSSHSSSGSSGSGGANGGAAGGLSIGNGLTVPPSAAAMATVVGGDFWDTFHSQSSPRAAAGATSAASAASAVAGGPRTASVVASARVTPALHASPVPASGDHAALGCQDMYERSNVRLVFMDKVVCALVGSEKAETLLGFATFGSAEGKQRFIGFYSLDKDGCVGFQSYAELLSLHPASAGAGADADALATTSTSTATATTTSSSTSTTTTNTSTTTATTTSTASAVTTERASSPVPGTTTSAASTASAAATAEPVQQLLKQISAAELYNAVSLLRDPVSGEFDLSLLQRHWPASADTQRIYISVE